MGSYFISSKKSLLIFDNDMEILNELSKIFQIQWNDVRGYNKTFTSNFDIIEKEDIVLSGIISPRFIAMTVFNPEAFAEFAIVIAGMLPEDCEPILYDEALGHPIMDLIPTPNHKSIINNFSFPT